MKNKFIRVVSPISAGIAVLLDVAVIFYFVFLIQKLLEKSFDMWTIMFAVIEVFAVAIAVAVSIEVFKHGVKFEEEKLTFTAVDDNNEFLYSNIDHIETLRDTKASLRKNFVDRYSHIYIHTNSNEIVTVTLGLTTNKTLKKIVDEINARIKN